MQFLEKVVQLKNSDLMQNTTPLDYKQLTLGVLNGARNCVQTPYSPQAVMLISARMLDTIPDIGCFLDLPSDAEHDAGIDGKFIGMFVLLIDTIGDDIAFFGLDANAEIVNCLVLKQYSETIPLDGSVQFKTTSPFI